MRNLKKILALVLALVMSMSLVAVANAADFSDAADIEYQEAVDVLYALEVIDGVGNNTFNPNGTVTRAQMAKMITIISLGNVDPAAFLGTATDLKDINGHWAEAYIKYCYSQGIIAGKGNGIFDPNANVTTAEASKMLLVAIGYSSDVQGYEGAQWAINVTRDAQLSGFYEDVSVPSNQALTRDQAAQMMYNAVQTNSIRQQKSQNQETGAVTISYIADGAPLLSKTFGVVTYEGLLYDVSYDSEKQEYTYYVFHDENGDGVMNSDTGENDSLSSFTTADDFSNLFMQEVKVLYKMKDNKAVVYGVTGNGSAVLAEGVLGNIKDYSSLTADAEKIELNGTEYKLDNQIDATKMIEYVKCSTYTYADNTDVLDALDESNKLNAYTNASYSFQLIDRDGNGKGDYMVTFPYAVREVTYVGTTSFTIAGAAIDGGTSYKFEDVNAYDGIAKGDYAVVTAQANALDNTTTFAKADMVSGKVTGLKSTEVAVDGTWYKLATADATVMGNSYDFAVVNGYVFSADVTAESSKDVLFLAYTDSFTADFGGTTGLLEAKVVIGTEEKIVKLATVNGDKIDGTVASALTVGLYTYTVNSEGNYEIKAVSSTNKANYDMLAYDSGDLDKYIFTNSSDKLGTSTNELNIADDAVVYVKKAADTTGTTAPTGDLVVITGKQLKAHNDDLGDVLVQALVSTVSGIKYAKVIAIVDIGNTMPTTSGVDLLYGYVVNDANGGPYIGTNDDGDTVKWMTLWNGTEEVTVYVDDETVAVNKGDAISYKTVSGSEIDTITVLSTKVAVTGTENKPEGIFEYENGSSVTSTTLDEDVVVIGIDSKNKKGAEIDLSGIQEAMSENDEKLTPNVIISGSPVEVIFYDVNNKLDGVTEVSDTVVSALNTAQDGNNTLATNLLTLTDANTSLLNTIDALDDPADGYYKLVDKDVDGTDVALGVALGTAIDSSKVTVTVNRVTSAISDTVSSDLTGKTFHAASEVELNGAGTQVQISATGVTASSDYTAYTITVAPVVVEGATTAPVATKTVTVIVFGED